MMKIGLYIHIPFCQQKCLYCDFLSAPAEKDLQERYFHALLSEIVRTAEEYRDREVITVFIGGGTPSLPAAKWIMQVMGALKDNFRFAEHPEISMEMNPGTETLEKLTQYRKAGINRLSIGCQSLQDEELRILGRIHNAAGFYRCYEDARQAGFDNINIDLMSAVPGQTRTSWLDTLCKILALSPEHISAYSLIIEEGTPFYEKYGDVSRGNLYDISLQIQETNEQPERLPDEETERLMYADTLQYMCENGYHRYEISNYARNDVHNRNRYECRHNRVYWERGDYLGFGIGAASLMDNVRWSNCRDIERYVMETGNPDKIREQREKLSIHAQMEEFMFLGLRLTEGIRISEFETYFGVPIAEIYGNRIRKFQQEKLLEQKGDFIRLTAKGTDLSNYVMAEFLFDHADQKNE